MRSFLAKTLMDPEQLSSLFNDDAVDDDLLRYLVGTLYLEREPLFASIVMGALVTGLAWAMTHEGVFIAYAIANILVGAARLHLLHRYRRDSAAPTTARRRWPMIPRFRSGRRSTRSCWDWLLFADGAARFGRRATFGLGRLRGIHDRLRHPQFGSNASARAAGDGDQRSHADRVPDEPRSPTAAAMPRRSAHWS